MESGREVWQRQMDAAMKAVPCPHCGAEIGKYCFRSRTVCSARAEAENGRIFREFILYKGGIENAIASVSSDIERCRGTRVDPALRSCLGVLIAMRNDALRVTAPADPGNTKEKNVKDEQELEEKIVAAGKTAPRVTPEHIDACIMSEVYFTAGEAAEALGLRGNMGGSVPIPRALHLLTFCVITLRNGFTVTGESACASPENFDAEIGQQIARKNAREKIWALEGYALKERLSQGGAR